MASLSLLRASLNRENGIFGDLGILRMPIPKVCTQVLLALLWGIKLATLLEKVSTLWVGRVRLRSPGIETGSGGLCTILGPGDTTRELGKTGDTSLFFQGRKFSLLEDNG